MVERDVVFHVKTAGHSTYEAGDFLQVDLELPRTPSEFYKRLDSLSFHERYLQAEQLGRDLGSACLRKLSLRNRLQEMSYGDGPKKVSEKTALIIEPGLGAWKGLKLPNSVNPLVRDAFGGTYNPVSEYFVAAGFDVDDSFPRNGFVSGDLDGSEKNFAELVHKKLENSRIVVVVAQSFGGEVAQYYASKNPDEAKRVLFFLGASPIPVDVNYWVAGAYLSVNGTKSFQPLRQTAEFMRSKQAREIQFENIIADPDYVLRGLAAPGNTRITHSGHSGVYYDSDNLDYVVDVSNARLAYDLVYERNRSFGTLMRTSVPLVVA